MVVCRYFLSGNCKYGDRCYNEHPRGNANGPAGGGGRGVTFRDSFGMAGQQGQNPYRWTAPSGSGQQQPQQQQQQQGGGISVQDIVKSLPKEMEVWQTSKMWPFSCFSLEKEIPCLPEFVDMSPEEMRLDAYTAIQQGTVDAFKQKVSQLVQDFRQKQDQIKGMPPPLRQKLVEMLEEGRRQKAARGSGQAVVRPSTFGAQSGGGSGGGLFGAGTSSVFGNTATATNPPSSSSSSSLFGNASSPSTFGASSQPSSLFGQSPGGTASVFGSGQSASGTTSVFGQTQPAPGLFGKGAPANSASGTASIFGQAQPAPGLFGKSTPASSVGGSVFGQGAATGGGGLFAQPGGGGAGGGAVATPPVGLFGKAPSAGGVFNQSSGAGSPFGQNAGGGGSVFGQNAGGGSVFGQSGGGGSVFGQGGGSVFGQTPTSSSPSLFGQASVASAAPGLLGAAPSQPGLFGNAPTNSAPPQPGLFGSGGATAGSTFGNAAAPSASDAALYTPMADLTDSEKAQFQAKMFTPGMIPMRPPPRELINV